MAAEGEKWVVPMLGGNADKNLFCESLRDKTGGCIPSLSPVLDAAAKWSSVTVR
jgi:hypothetical protein